MTLVAYISLKNSQWNTKKMGKGLISKYGEWTFTNVFYLRTKILQCLPVTPCLYYDEMDLSQSVFISTWVTWALVYGLFTLAS